MRGAAVVIALVALSACSDTSDAFAVRNATGDELTVTLETTAGFTSYDCDDHDGTLDLGLGGSATIAVGRRRCFEGPVRGSDYDARDLVVDLTVSRGGVTCVEDTGAELLLRDFEDEGYHDTWTVDDATCP